MRHDIIQCKSCLYCKPIGRQQANARTLGRKKYFCVIKQVLGMVGQHHPEAQQFIGFGSDTADSPLVMKTYPRWCLRAEWKKKDCLLEGKTHEG